MLLKLSPYQPNTAMLTISAISSGHRTHQSRGVASLPHRSVFSAMMSIVSRIKEAKKRKRYHPDDSPIDEVIEDDGPMELTREEAED